MGDHGRRSGDTIIDCHSHRSEINQRRQTCRQRSCQGGQNNDHRDAHDAPWHQRSIGVGSSTATDPHGAACSGIAIVGVPRDEGDASVAVDSGGTFDSLAL